MPFATNDNRDVRPLTPPRALAARKIPVMISHRLARALGYFGQEANPAAQSTLAPAPASPAAQAAPPVMPEYKIKTAEEVQREVEEEYRAKLEDVERRYREWQPLDQEYQKILTERPEFKTPYTAKRSDEIIIDMPNGDHFELIDRNGSGWMIRENWQFWSWKKSKGEKDAANYLEDYRRRALTVLDDANGLIKRQHDTLKQALMNYKLQRQREEGLFKQEKSSIAGERDVALAQALERLEAEKILEQELEAAVAAGQIRPEDAPLVRSKGMERYLADKASATRDLVASRAEPIRQAEILLQQAQAALAALPLMPDVRYAIDSKQTKRIVKYDAKGQEVDVWVLMDVEGSGWMPEAELTGWMDARRRKNDQLVDEIGARAREKARDWMNEVVLSNERFKQAVKPQREVLEPKIANLVWALQIMNLPRELTPEENTKLNKELEIAVKPVPVPSKVLVLIDSSDFRVIETPHGRFQLRNAKDSGWMMQREWDQWNTDIVAKNYKESAKKKAAYRAKAAALMEGKSLEEADRASTEAWDAMGRQQDEDAKKSGVTHILDEASKLWEDKKGEILTVLGVLALVIPVVGLALGPILSAAGKYVTEDEKKKLAERIATRREADLTALKKQLDDGVITQQQYEAGVAQITGEEYRAMTLEDAVLDRPDIQQAAASEAAKAAAAARNKKILVYGGAAAGTLATVFTVLSMFRR